MYELIKEVLDENTLKYTIRELSNGNEYLALNFIDKDKYEREYNYSLLILTNERTNAVSLIIPSIKPIPFSSVNEDRKILEEKIDFLNNQICLFGQLELFKKQVTYEYNFVYIDSKEYLGEVLMTLLNFLETLVYETGIVISSDVKLDTLKGLVE